MAPPIVPGGPARKVGPGVRGRRWSSPRSRRIPALRHHQVIRTGGVAEPAGMPTATIGSPRAALVSRRIGWMVAAIVTLLLAVLLSLGVGARPIAPAEVLQSLLYGGTSEAAEIVRSLRVPRTLVGVMVGAGLAL